MRPAGRRPAGSGERGGGGGGSVLRSADSADAAAALRSVNVISRRVSTCPSPQNMPHGRIVGLFIYFYAGVKW